MTHFFITLGYIAVGLCAGVLTVELVRDYWPRILSALRGRGGNG